MPSLESRQHGQVRFQSLKSEHRAHQILDQWENNSPVVSTQVNKKTDEGQAVLFGSNSHVQEWLGGLVMTAASDR